MNDNTIAIGDTVIFKSAKHFRTNAPPPMDVVSVSEKNGSVTCIFWNDGASRFEHLNDLPPENLEVFKPKPE